LKYQDIFSKAGIFSPSYWFSDTVWTFTQEMGHQQNMKIYQLCGSLEAGSMVTDTWRMNDTLLNLGFLADELFVKIVEGGDHNEQLWRENFTEAYLWLFASFANELEQFEHSDNLKLFPNPAEDKLYLPNFDKNTINSGTIYKMDGTCVIKTVHLDEDFIDVSLLKPGTYIIEFKTNKSTFQGKFVKK
jgi:hypothetical protein